MKELKERPTEGMPDMMPKGTVDNPPQKEPQNIPTRMQDQPYEEPGNMDTKENKDKHDGRDEVPDEHTREIPEMPNHKPRPDQDIRDNSDC